MLFTGKHCEIDVDECLSNPCENGAECVNGKDSYKCICPAGYQGERCSVSSLSDCLYICI